MGRGISTRGQLVSLLGLRFDDFLTPTAAGLNVEVSGGGVVVVLLLGRLRRVPSPITIT